VPRAIYNDPIVEAQLKEEGLCGKRPTAAQLKLLRRNGEYTLYGKVKKQPNITKRV
jgi:hypothetical protein